MANKTWTLTNFQLGTRNYPLVNIQKTIEHGPVEIVSFPIQNGGSFQKVFGLLTRPGLNGIMPAYPFQITKSTSTTEMVRRRKTPIYITKDDSLQSHSPSIFHTTRNPWLNISSTPFSGTHMRGVGIAWNSSTTQGSRNKSYQSYQSYPLVN